MYNFNVILNYVQFSITLKYSAFLYFSYAGPFTCINIIINEHINFSIRHTLAANNLFRKE